MSRRVRVQTEGPGQDSFLDVVANLVGVLIILVMVVGTQAKQVMVQTIAAVPKTDVDTSELDAAKVDLHNTEVQLAELERKIREEEFAIAQRREERSRLLMITQLAERELEAAKAKLSEKEQIDLDANSQRRTLEQELDRIQKTLAGIDLSPAKTEVIKHYPTPLAKTVWGKEAHFRLCEGRIVRVPLEEMLDQMVIEAKVHAWKLKDASSFTETLGPVQDFRLQYTIVKVEHRGMVGAQLGRAHVILTRENMGEPVAQALKPGSDFEFTLKELDPRKCAITIWTYPDSYKDYRAIREILHKKGFVTAGRPMPDGYPISVAPDGNRSSGQ